MIYDKIGGCKYYSKHLVVCHSFKNVRGWMLTFDVEKSWCHWYAEE